MSFKNALTKFRELLNLPINIFERILLEQETSLPVWDEKHDPEWQKAHAVGEGIWTFEWSQAVSKWKVEGDQEVVPLTVFWLEHYFERLTRTEDTEPQKFCLSDLLYDLFPFPTFLQAPERLDTRDRMQAAVFVLLGFGLLNTEHGVDAEELLRSFMREWLKELGKEILKVVELAGNPSDTWEMKRVFVMDLVRRRDKRITITLGYDPEVSHRSIELAATTTLVFWRPEDDAN